MRKLSLMILALGAFMTSPNAASATVDIFACAPEWGALAQEIGGDKVDVFTASKANKDIHYMRAKPSLLASMRRADLVICSGASLEVGWLPILLNKAGGNQVQEGAVGSIMAADYVPLLEIMDHVDRSMGHVHPDGNPHVHLDPNNILLISKIMTQRLSEIDAPNTLYYQANENAFASNWQSNITQWNVQAAALKGQKVVVYHKSWSYLLNWLGMESVASLEPKPGVPPNAAHLEKVLQAVQGQNVKGILVAPFENAKGAKWLSEKAGIPIIQLPFTVGGNSQSKDLKTMFDDTINQLNQ